MDSNEPKQTLNWWISSLAISVVCCAVLFIIFAGYLMDIKDNQVVNRVRLDTLEQRMNSITNEVDDLYHRTTVQQIQVMPTSNQVQGPASATPSAASPSASGTAGATGATAIPAPPDAANTVPAPSIPPAAAPATAPAAATAPATAAPAEIPAK